MNTDYKLGMTGPELDAFLFSPLHSSLLSVKQGLLSCNITFNRETVTSEWKGQLKRKLRDTAEMAFLRLAVILKECRVIGVGIGVGEGVTRNFLINGNHYFVHIDREADNIFHFLCGLASNMKAFADRNGLQIPPCIKMPVAHDLD